MYQAMGEIRRSNEIARLRIAKVPVKVAAPTTRPRPGISVSTRPRPVVLNPALAVAVRNAQEQTQAPLRRLVTAVLEPVRNAPRSTILSVARQTANKLRTPVLPVVNKPLAFEPRPALPLPSVAGPIAPPAPAASIPEMDYDDDGSEITPVERAAFIDDARPVTEAYSSGFVPDDGEESFEPDVPEMIEPSDLTPVAPTKKPLSLPMIGGILMLLNFL